MSKPVKSAPTSTFITKAGYARTYTSKQGALAEEEQTHIRERLLKARQSRGMTRTQVPGISSSTLCTFELHDISTMKMGDMAFISRAYDMDFNDFVAYLLGLRNDEVGEAASGSSTIPKIVATLSDMDVHKQMIVLDIVRAIRDL